MEKFYKLELKQILSCPFKKKNKIKNMRSTHTFQRTIMLSLVSALFVHFFIIQFMKNPFVQ